MIIFFDLDGPLLDVAPRYKILHRNLLEGTGVTAMDSELYWERKRNRETEAAILEEIGASDIQPLYSSRRLNLIEQDGYLEHDCPWLWTDCVLGTIAAYYPLVLVTVRSNTEALHRQLARLNLRHFFDAVLSEAAVDPVDEQKARLIRDYLSQQSLPERGHWIIGDTEADIGAGQLLGLITVAVCCGIRDREHLAKLNPIYLIEDIRSLPALILGKGQV